MNDDEKRELTIYLIRKDFGPKSNTYRIDKIVACIEQECYHVTYKPNGPAGTLREQDVWCDCQGFRQQNFDKTRHKHVMLVTDYVSRGAPAWAEYNIIGTGKDAKIEFLRSAPDGG